MFIGYCEDSYRVPTLGTDSIWYNIKYFGWAYQQFYIYLGHVQLLDPDTSTKLDCKPAEDDTLLLIDDAFGHAWESDLLECYLCVGLD